eukprot:6452508-Prymnesium_polylepis.2
MLPSDPWSESLKLSVHDPRGLESHALAVSVTEAAKQRVARGGAQQLGTWYDLASMLIGRLEDAGLRPHLNLT